MLDIDIWEQVARQFDWSDGGVLYVNNSGNELLFEISGRTYAAYHGQMVLIPSKYDYVLKTRGINLTLVPLEEHPLVRRKG